MFGYITPQVCELKVRDYELFKAYYCGLCKALGKEYRRTAVLNYDCTFIYLLGDSLQNAETDVQSCKCALHPVRGRCKVVSNSVVYATDVNILMAAAKAADDVQDRGGLLSRLALKGLGKAYRKAAARIPAINSLMLETAQKLGELERTGSANTDEVADTYARLFGAVLQELDVVQSHILYDIGYSLGRWVYLIDAYDDIEEDIKNGNYNVFVNRYHLVGKPPEDVKQQVELSFNYTLSQAMEALSRLELKKNRVLLENIICFGLKARTRAALAGIKNKGRLDEPIPGAGR